MKNRNIVEVHNDKLIRKKYLYKSEEKNKYIDVPEMKGEEIKVPVFH